MSNYFRLLDDLQVAGRWHLGEVINHNTEMPLEELWTGTPAPEGVSLRVDVTDVGIELEFCLTSFAVPVASAKLSQAIAAIAGRDLQRLALVVPGHRGFEVLNSVRVIECLDEKRSEFTKWTEEDHRADLAGQYRMVTNLRIDPHQIPADAHFFRVGRWPIALVVSEAVKSAMHECGCFGAKFESVI